MINRRGVLRLSTQERCIPILRQAGARLVVVGTWQIDVSMVVGVQRMGDKPMAARTLYSGDDLDTGALHPSQWKTTKKQ